jgi:hypothetical protein
MKAVLRRPVTVTIIWLTVFSIAMGYLETAVVVYLRKLLYSGEFPFPLSPVEADLAVVEFWREVATILMLAGAGVIAGRNNLERFAYFLFCFALWDIFYYVFLKALLDWPQTLTDWDILFLIPVPWVGPVLAPCIVALTMIAFAMIVVWLQEKGHAFKVKWLEWGIMLAGCLVILASFMWDYIAYVQRNEPGHGLWTLASNNSLFSEARSYIPEQYNWWLFLAGELLICAGIWWMVRRVMTQKVTGEQENLLRVIKA